MITDISQLDIKRVTKARRAVTLEQATIKETNISEMTANLRMMRTYQQDWDMLTKFRERYNRVCRYNRGDQWGDVIQVDGKAVTEEEHIISQGKLPLKQNIIRSVAKSLSGQFRSDRGKSIVISRKPNQAHTEKMLSNALQYALQINSTREIDARTFDLYILSGLPIQKIGYDFIDKYGHYDIVIDYIDPQYIFFNGDIKDVRLNDLRRIGQIHDISKDELYVHFAKSPEDKNILDNIYASALRDELLSEALSQKSREVVNFYLPTDPSKRRVIEVWEKKAVDIIEYWDKADGTEGYWELSLDELIAVNEARAELYMRNDIPEDEWLLIEYDQSVAFKWFFKYLSPWGHVLREGETPYSHRMHPYVMYPYPLINGEVWGVLEDIIDQQRYLNRLTTLWDFIMGTSAKNTLVIDKKSLDGQSPENLGVAYREVGGVIVLDLSQGAQRPFELGGNLPNLGISELIGMQIKWMQDISGVQPSQQGQPGMSGTPASKFAMEISQSALNNRDLLESFNAFRRDRDMKVLQTLIQFYRTKRYLAIAGDDDEQVYDPTDIGEIADYSLTIGQSMDTPAYKGWIDEMLKEFVMNGLIDIEMFLTHSNLPFAQALLEDVRNRQEQIQQGTESPQNAIAGLSQTFQNQQGVDVENINKMSQRFLPNQQGIAE